MEPLNKKARYELHESLSVARKFRSRKEFPFSPDLYLRFLFEGEPRTEKREACHRSFLKSIEFFRAMLESGFSDSRKGGDASNPLEINMPSGVGPQALKLFLDAVYGLPWDQNFLDEDNSGKGIQEDGWVDLLLQLTVLCDAWGVKLDCLRLALRGAKLKDHERLVVWCLERLPSHLLPEVLFVEELSTLWQILERRRRSELLTVEGVLSLTSRAVRSYDYYETDPLLTGVRLLVEASEREWAFPERAPSPELVARVAERGSTLIGLGSILPFAPFVFKHVWLPWVERYVQDPKTVCKMYGDHLETLWRSTKEPRLCDPPKRIFGLSPSHYVRVFSASDFELSLDGELHSGHLFHFPRWILGGTDELPLRLPIMIDGVKHCVCVALGADSKYELTVELTDPLVFPEYRLTAHWTPLDTVSKAWLQGRCPEFDPRGPGLPSLRRARGPSPSKYGFVAVAQWTYSDEQDSDKPTQLVGATEILDCLEEQLHDVPRRKMPCCLGTKDSP